MTPLPTLVADYRIAKRTYEALSFSAAILAKRGGDCQAIDDETAHWGRHCEEIRSNILTQMCVATGLDIPDIEEVFVVKRDNMDRFADVTIVLGFFGIIVALYALVLP